MALTYTQTGAIVASCAGAVLITLITILLSTNMLNSMKFRRRRINTPCIQPRQIQRKEALDVETQRHSFCTNSRSIPGDFETYGNLTIPPDRRPIPTAFDIINRVLMATVLPTGTTVNSDAPKKGIECSPRGSITLPKQPSITPSEQVGVAMCETKAEAKANGVSAECDDGGITGYTELARQEGQAEEKRDGFEACAVEKQWKSCSFGTGKSMTALYHAV
ncbi:hypothetical protein DDE82_004344 [Stemphylium lycopersici]|nr:hypothetical protein TW65_06451 [Stemphylium lycopersici]RAR04865.1 hypothetical protein DDE82_004344 [Stemphylium lycopersici]